jgi:hypothetical protein
MNGTRYGPKLSNFMFALHAISPVGFQFVSGNLDLMGNRNLRRIMTTKRVEPFLICDQEHLVKQIANWIAIVLDPNQRAVIGLSIDGVKTAKLVQH